MNDVYTLKVCDRNGKETGSVEISAASLGGVVRRRLLKDVLLIQERNQRQGSANSKTRGEIRATSKKPFRQKGTGRARAGNKNSNIWKGGSVAHGPRPRNFMTEIPRKMKKRALASAVLGKIIDDEFLLIDDLSFEKPSTKAAQALLDAFGIGGSVLLANHLYDENTLLSFRNLPQTSVFEQRDINVLDLLKKRKILMTEQAFHDMLKRLDLGQKEKVVVA
jgi:large subunit ribosomal protein L4